MLNGRSFPRVLSTDKPLEAEDVTVSAKFWLV